MGDTSDGVYTYIATTDYLGSVFKTFASQHSIKSYFVGEVNYGYDTINGAFKTVGVWIIGPFVLKIVELRNEDKPSEIEFKFLDYAEDVNPLDLAKDTLNKLLSSIIAIKVKSFNDLITINNNVYLTGKTWNNVIIDEISDKLKKVEIVTLVD